MAHQLPSSGYVLGLDVGDARIGVAVASVIARLPQPLTEVKAGETAYEAIKNVIRKEDVHMLIIGIPRNLEGSETAQSQKIRQFADELAVQIDIPVVFADESLSSQRAAELAKNNQFKNVSQDSLAACFILEEFFATIDTITEGVS